MPITEPSPQGDILFAFLSILFEGAPYILLGTIVSGFIDAFLPGNLLERLLPKNRFMAVLVSGLLGGVFPVCECAIVPVIRRLVRKGLPLSCAITYMLSAPIINPIVVISTLSAFDGQSPWFMTLSRVAMAYVVTVTIGLAVGKLRQRSVLKDSVSDSIERGVGGEHDHSALPTGTKVVLAMRTAMRDFLDTAMYFTVGVLITAVFNTQFDQGILNEVAGNDAFAVPVMMVLAFVLSLCSTSDAFIIAPLTVFSPVAKLAFLVFGPMMDVKLIFMYSSVFKPKFVLGLLVGVALLIGLLCIPWSLAFP
ncbi:permease [soil metagenome]